MIVDTNVSLGQWPFRRLAVDTTEALLRLMDSHGVTQAWVGAFEGLFYRDMGSANRLLRERLAGHEERLQAWAVINPKFPGWERDLSEALEAGMAGVRLYPNYHAYDLADACATELLTQLALLGVPVAIYYRVVDERLHHWRCPVPPTEVDLPSLLGSHPHLTCLLCGFGMPFAEQHAELVRAHRVYLEISRLEGIEAVRGLCETVGSNHVVLGSHAPYFYMQAAHLKIVEAGLTETERADVLYRSSQALLCP